jgi:hypothetical protein
MLIKASASPSLLHIPARWGPAALQESLLGSCILRIKGCPNNPLRPATVPARPAPAFLAHPTRFERVTFAFRALLLAEPALAGPLPLPDQSAK